MKQDVNSADPRWRRKLERLGDIRWSRAVLASALLVAVVVVIGVVIGVTTADDPPAPGVGTASPIDSNSSRPPDNPSLAPNEDPAANSAYGIEAQKLTDELRTHDVPFTDADANILVDIGDKNVARNEPDLTADDPLINDQVTRAFPQFTEQQRADTVRCLAEYVEQTYAKLHGTVPPDGHDHN